MYRSRWVDQDKEVFEALGGGEMVGLYARLAAIKFDIGTNLQLGMFNLLRKDCKKSVFASDLRIVYSSVFVPLEALYGLEWGELVHIT